MNTFGLSAQTRFNIKSTLDLLFINNGLYVNVASGQYDVSGDRADLLKRVSSTLYESPFDNWIYESDASGISPYQPEVASGVYINGVFNQKGSGVYKPRIDYRNGRVFFDNPVPANSIITAKFSYKGVRNDFPDSRKVNWIFSKLKDAIDFTENVYPSGFQRQLPAVIIDVQKRFSRPFALGGAKNHNTLVVLHVLANSNNSLERINDLLTEESFRKPIKAINFNKIPVLFTNKGDLATTYKPFTQLQGDLAFEAPKLYIDKAELISVNEIRGVWISRVDWTVTSYHLP